ncbi:hypothetical protein BDR05DRAFT_778621 [Suillus weaverae]|nr:hypothetical protein BDR05DRAFT_778621 [Suillus weaverae]
MKKSNSRNAQAVLMLSTWLQCGTGRLWLLLGGQHTRKQNERMSNKFNRTAKPRRRHRTLSLPMPQHPRHLMLQVQQLHNHHPSHGGLRLYCFSVVHLRNTPMVINTASVAAYGQLLHFYFY